MGSPGENKVTFEHSKRRVKQDPRFYVGTGKLRVGALAKLQPKGEKKAEGFKGG